jgi:hypothetical protein
VRPHAKSQAIRVNDEDADLNPLAVGPRAGHSVPSPNPLSSDVGLRPLVWTLVIALSPLLFDGIFTGVIGRRPFYTVSLFHIGLGLFGLTLAALVRILGHGRGATLVPFLIIAAVVEVVIALYFGGTFSQNEVKRNDLQVDIQHVEVTLSGGERALTKPALTQIREDMKAVQSSDPEATPAGYIVLAVFGLFSLFALVRYWKPPTEPERRVEEAAGGA